MRCVDDELVLEQKCLQAGVHDLCLGRGCTIPLVQHRALRLAQLEALLNHVKRRCSSEGWMSTKPGVSQPLTENTINLYDLLFWVIKPATRRRRCSFIELIADGDQLPTWFVSHWWGGPVSDFYCCLMQHRKDRMLAVDSSYWICAYAINQWIAGDEVGHNPAASSFQKAMSISHGTVSIIDAAAVVYRRMWCCYEVFVSLHGVQAQGTTGNADTYMYDVYTKYGDEAVGIIDGFAAADMSQHEDFWKDDKRSREAKFPLSLVRQALRIKLQDAEASVEIDKRHILNVIIDSKDLNAAAPAEHANYEELNRTLRGRFAASSLAAVFDSDLPLDEFCVALAESPMSELKISLQDTVVSDIRATALAQAIPRCLIVLDLNLGGTGLTNQGLKVLAASLPPSLQVIWLYLGKTLITDDAMKGLVPAFQVCLQSLGLELHSTALKDEGIRYLASALPISLQNLLLDLRSTAITDASAISLAGALPSSVRELTLFFTSTSITDDGLRSLAHVFPASLLALDLHVRHTAVTSEGVNCIAVALPAFLRTFTLSSGKAAFTDHTMKIMSMNLPTSLRHLELHIPDTEITDESLQIIAAVFPRSMQVFKMDIPEESTTEKQVQLLSDALKSQGVEHDILRWDK